MEHKKNSLRALQSPANAYRAKIFWSWNGKLEKAELLRQIDTIKEMGFGGFFMHSRVGLDTEYLGEEWFTLVRACADYAYELGLEAWLYDEDRWPSGISGGAVTEREEYRMRFISLYHTDEEIKNNPLIKRELGRFAVKINERNELLDYKPLGLETPLPTGYGLDIFVEELMKPDEGYNGYTYLDTLNPEAVKRFLQTTHEVYKANVGDLFGTKIKGIFMDEPHRGTLFNDLGTYNENHQNMAPYTEKLFQKYQEDWQSDVSIKLPEIFYRAQNGKWNKTTHHYLQTVENLYLNAFAKQYYEWCKQNDLLVTGHIFHEDSLYMQTLMNGSVMRFYEYMDYPGVDTLGREHRYFTTVKQCASVARQLGKKFVLSELFGCTGWQTTFDEFKKFGDWQTFYGATLHCPHLSWYTMEGEAKRDYPASILHQSYWHTEYAYLEDYFARFIYLLTEGEPQIKTLVIHPIEQMWGLAHSSWMKDWFTSIDERAVEMDTFYERQLQELSARHIEFDYGDEALLEKYARVETRNGTAYIKVGCVYYEEVLDSYAGFQRASTKRLLDEFKRAGGKVVSTVGELSTRDCIQASAGVFATVRKLDGDAWLLLKGLSNALTTTERISLPDNLTAYANVELWDFRTGKSLGKIDISSYTFDFTQEREYALRFTDEEIPYQPRIPKIPRTELPKEMRYELTEPNILVLDRAKYYIDGELQNDGKERDVLKIDEAVRTACDLPKRGGGMLQPWFVKKYNIFDTEKPLKDIRLEFSFTVTNVPKNVYIAIEQSERYAVYFNGERIPVPQEPERWVDICFDKIPLPDLRLGENTICLETRFSQATNIECAYLLGDFAVSEKREIVALPQTLKIGEDLCKQGFPYYSASIKYHTGIHEGEIRLQFEDIHCAVMKVFGGEKAEYIAFAPYELPYLQLKEELVLECFFTRRNTFAALRLKEVFRDRYNPWLYTIEEGDEYSEEHILIKQGI